METMDNQLIAIQKLSDLVDGYLSQNGKNLREGEVLYHLARCCPYGGKIAEIGSWKGKSTIWLAKGAKHTHSKVYAIDHHVGSKEHQASGKVWTFDIFINNIQKAELTDVVIPVLKTSQDAISEIPDSLDLLFIDGAHEYEGVKSDLDLYRSKVKKGGVIAFHDSFGSGWPGVRKFVHKEVFASPYFAKVRYMNSITYAVVTDRATFTERVSNYWALLVKNIHEKQSFIPQPFRSIIKKLTWQSCTKRWLQDLERFKN